MKFNIRLSFTLFISLFFVWITYVSYDSKLLTNENEKPNPDINKLISINTNKKIAKEVTIKVSDPKAISSNAERIPKNLFKKSINSKRSISSETETEAKIENPISVSTQNKINPEINHEFINQIAISSKNDNPSKEINNPNEINNNNNNNNNINNNNNSKQDALKLDIKATKEAKTFNFPDRWISIGVGASYTYSKQELENYNSCQISSIDSPHISIRSGGLITEKNGVDFIYKEVSGKLSNDSSGTKVVEHYKWKVLSAEILHLEKQNYKLWGYNYEIYYRFGIQNHQFFTIIPSSPNSVKIETLTTGITNLSAGLEYKIMTRKNVRTEILMRFQYPFSSASKNIGDTFSVSPIFSFDGSLGYVYKANNNITLGSYWFGQWQFFKFNYKKSANNFSGSQLFFNSIVDLRIGYDF